MDRRHGMRQAVAPRLAHEGAALHEVVNRLLEEERIASGALHQEALEREQLVVTAEQGVEQFSGPVRRERPQVQAQGVRAREPPVVVLGPIRHDDERGRREPVHEQLERVLGIGVDPLKISDDEDEWLAARRRADEAKVRLESPLASARRVGAKERIPRLERAELPQHRRDVRAELRIERAHRGVDLVAHGLRRIGPVEAEVAPEQVEADAPARGPRVRLRLGAEDGGAARPAGLHELPDQARLADARLSAERDEPCRPLAHRVECGREPGELFLAPDERQWHPATRLRAQRRADAADHLEHLDGLGEALDVDGADRPRAHAAAGHGDGVGTREHGAGLGELLEARRQVDGLPHRGERRRVGAEGPQHDLSGVEAHADQDRDPVGPLDVVAVCGDPLLHPQRGVARADRVILLGHGRAEQRHDPIAQHLGHGALPAAHRLDHVLDDLIEERRGLLGVVARQHRHRRGDVGEEDADVLALPGQIRARPEEVGHALRVMDGRWERHPAVRAESRPRRRRLSALRTADHSALRRRSSGTPARPAA